ncbi:hypothetical protein ACN38_g5771 [Penicillium nordicum]|uniref:Uncharacterized protein n=1 Tax=Penicillium nordicum TaxID=229535 RepID=A0A0M9WG12_9EURO|nr:hypothetical protein ACN38_g5771 [Penicillium nordicum]
MSLDESAVSLLSIPTRSLAEILRMVPMLCSNGNFVLWSELFKRALDIQDTRYWSIISDGPNTCFMGDGTIRPAINFELLEAINISVDVELQALIAHAKTPRVAFELLKGYFTERYFHQSHSRYISWINCVYTPSMDPMQFVHEWRSALSQLVESLGTANLPFKIQLHQFFLAVSMRGDPEAVDWVKTFGVDCTWSGSDSLEDACQSFVRFEVSRLHAVPDDKRATGDTNMIKNETSPTVYKLHEE